MHGRFEKHLHGKGTKRISPYYTGGYSAENDELSDLHSKLIKRLKLHFGLFFLYYSHNMKIKISFINITGLLSPL